MTEVTDQEIFNFIINKQIVTNFDIGDNLVIKYVALRGDSTKYTFHFNIILDGRLCDNFHLVYYPSSNKLKTNIFDSYKDIYEAFMNHIKGLIIIKKTSLYQTMFES